MNIFNKNIEFFKDGKAWFCPTLCSELADMVVPKDIKSITVPKNTILMSENDYPDRMFYVLKGLIIQQTANALMDKPYSTVNVNIPGSITSRMMFFCKHTTYLRTIALKNTELIAIPVNRIRKILTQDSDLYNEFVDYSAFCDRSAFLALKSIAMVDAEHRLITFLLMCLLAYGVKINQCEKDEWIKMPIKFSRNEIALMIYVTRPTMDRLLAKWMSDSMYVTKSDGFYVNARLFSLYTKFELL